MSVDRIKKSVSRVQKLGGASGTVVGSGYTLPKDNAIKNEPRGFSAEFVSSAFCVEGSTTL